MRIRPGLGALVASVAIALLGSAPVAAGPATEYPPGYEAYHTFEQMAAELRALRAAHPDLMRLGNIGTSYEGRKLFKIKISDRPWNDEAEPEVLITSLIHAREPISLEQSLALMRWLLEGYATDPRIRAIVDRTEIWILPNLNPDGHVWDYRAGKLRNWRKNRQPNLDSTAIGTDLNRNFPFQWGGSGASHDPSSYTYGGPAALSAPEARALRDFILSRRAGGRQRIALGLNLHSHARKILYPPGYTSEPLPPGMDAQDRATLRALAMHMAETNGYAVQQGGTWYHTSGNLGDWQYFRQRILSLTMELGPGAGADSRYLANDEIGPEIHGNREAILWWLEQAPCPSAVTGVACS